MSAERWLAAPDDPGYEVSSHGRVRSVPRTIVTTQGVERRLPGRMLSPRSLPSGHQWVTTAGGQTRYVHVLMLTAFVGPCPDGMESLHGDDDPTNNTLGNLRWGRRGENLRDRVRNGRHPQANRDRCPYRHLLAAPNLVDKDAREGHRSCLACSRGQSQHRYAATQGHTLNLQELSDAHYADILAHDGVSRSARFTPGTCSADSCGRSAVARGMCKRHWQIQSRRTKKVSA